MIKSGETLWVPSETVSPEVWRGLTEKATCGHCSVFRVKNNSKD